MCEINITVNDNNNAPGDGDIKEIFAALKQILNNQLIIMGAIDDLKAQGEALQTQVNDLQASLDAEQAQIQQLLDINAGVVTDLNNQITVLQEQIANGATAEQLQGVATTLSNISASIATTKADLEGTIPDSTPNNNGDTQA